MRLFITVNTSQAVKDQLASILPSVKCHYKGRFVPMDHWHITTLFLGEVEEKKIPLIEKAMRQAGKGIAPFELFLEGIGAFPSIKKPNILWAGIKGDTNPFEQLYHQLINEVTPLEIDFDAKPKFSPHLTLARKVIAQDCDKYGEIELKTEKWKVDALELYQSTFINQGVKYHRLLETPFEKKE